MTAFALYTTEVWLQMDNFLLRHDLSKFINCEFAVNFGSVRKNQHVEYFCLKLNSSCVCAHDCLVWE